jgi:DNA-binding MarR family transcriptional regulator
MQLLPVASVGRGKASVDACAAAVLDGLPQVMWFIRREMRRHRTRGLSVPQFRTLVLLNRYPTASLSVVAENLGAALPTASRMVSGLVRKGLVARRAHPTDRRQASLVLTPKGRAALNTARRATQEGVAREIARFSDDERAAIGRAMVLLQDAFAGTRLPGDNDGKASESD